MSDASDLIHDIGRHVAICTEQATRIAELEAALSALLYQLRMGAPVRDLGDLMDCADDVLEKTRP